MNIYVVARSALKQQPETCCGYINYNILILWLDIAMLKFILAPRKYIDWKYIACLYIW